MEDGEDAPVEEEDYMVQVKNGQIEKMKFEQLEGGKVDLILD